LGTVPRLQAVSIVACMLLTLWMVTNVLACCQTCVSKAFVYMSGVMQKRATTKQVSASPEPPQHW